MSDQGKTNYTAVAARIGGHFDHYDKLTPAIRAAYDAGAGAVEQWLADAPVDEDMLGNEPGRAAEVLAAIDRFERDLGFTAPELTGMRIDQLRGMVRGIFEDDDEDEFLADAASLDSDFGDEL